MAGIGTALSCFTGFRGKLLFFAGILALIGLGFNSLDLLEPEKGVRASGQGDSAIISGFTKYTRTLAEHSRSSGWGNAAIQIGLSFGIAMIFASLLRAFFKTMLIFLSLSVLICWFLHSKGMIDPFWEDFRFSTTEATGWLSGQFHTLKEFVGGVLPSASAAMTGFVLGLRR